MNQHIKANEFIFAKTHAEFLNKAFGTNYKAWMKSRWSYSTNTWVWMVHIDQKVRQGWRNRIINENEIWEEYVDSGEPTYSKEPERQYRIVVQILPCSNGLKKYRILGKYKFDFEKSTPRKHILIKVD